MSNTPTRFEALKAAVARAGNQSAFAANLGVSQPAVSGWINQSKQLPAEHVLMVENLYGVSRHDLRPDIYPRPPLLDLGSTDRFIGVDQPKRGSRILASGFAA